MEISDEVFINSMNDISKYFQIMLDNKDKKIADLQLQLDQAKSEITKYKILLNDMETENSHLETMLDQANERLKGLPKFGIGQKVYYVRDTTFSIEIDEIQSRQGNFFYVDYTYNEIFKESELVATREEAQELQNGDFSGE